MRSRKLSHVDVDAIPKQQVHEMPEPWARPQNKAAVKTPTVLRGLSRCECCDACRCCLANAAWHLAQQCKHADFTRSLPRPCGGPQSVPPLRPRPSRPRRRRQTAPHLETVPPSRPRGYGWPRQCARGAAACACVACACNNFSPLVPACKCPAPYSRRLGRRNNSEHTVRTTSQGRRHDRNNSRM